jgi:hypothetical protein
MCQNRRTKKKISFSYMHLICDYTLICTIATNRNNEQISCVLNRARESNKNFFCQLSETHFRSKQKLTFVKIYQEEEEEVMCLKKRKQLYTTSLFESVFLKKVIFESSVDLISMEILNQANMYLEKHISI